MTDQALISNHDEGSLWDELSHQHSREIQQHHRLSSSRASGPSFRTTLQNAAAAVSSAASAAAAAAAAAAERQRQTQYRNVVMEESAAATNGTGGGADAALAEFGLQPSALHHGEEYRPPYVGENIQSATVTARENVPSNNQNAPTTLGNHGEARGPDFNASLLSNEHGQPHAQQQVNAQENGTNFVFLDNFRLRTRREGWGAVSNLDLFFASIYNFYYHRGLVPIIGNGFVEIISLLFTLWLSVFLFAYLDWGALTTCTDETTCHADFNAYIIDKPFSRLSMWNFVIIIYCLLFSCYAIFTITTFLATVKDALQAKAFFEDKLGISARKLDGGAVEWDEIVQKIIRLQETGEYRVAIHGQEISALTVAQIIMRKENFMVAFVNRRMLDLTLPWPLNSRKEFFSKSLEWSMYFCILSYMFNHKYKIRPAFYMEPASLRRRFAVCAVAHAVFLPFLLFFMTLHFSMRHLYDWKSSKMYLGPREWSPVAKWTFREFNELPHAFERRLGPSYEAAEDYLKLFTKSPAVTSLGRALVFISGSLGAVLLAFAAVNDSILLHVKLGQWNLLWYVGILGITFSVGKGMLPDTGVHPPYIRNLFAEMDSALAKVAAHTHFYPDIWKGRGWDSLTQCAMSGMFQYKAKLFVSELLAVLFAPLILGISLPKCAEDICTFVQQTKVEVPGAGDVCGYSTFDFDTFEDESWEGRTIGIKTAQISRSQDDLQSSATESFPKPTVRLGGRPKTQHGKLEKSFFTFKAVHPSWKCSASGQNLVDRVETYQHQQAVALAKERNYHIEAAARQLETLRLLEERQLDQVGTGSARSNGIDESYIEKQAGISEADAGAHSGGESLPSRAAQGSCIGARTKPGAVPTAHRFNSEVDATAGIGASLPPLPRSGPSQNAPSSLFARNSSAGRPTSPANFSTTTSVLHYGDAALSAELMRVLNRSTLNPNLSVAGSVLGSALDHSLPSLSNLNATSSSVDPDEDEALDRNAQRQYLWLERYHSHLATQHEESEATEHGDGIDSPVPDHQRGGHSSCVIEGERRPIV